MSNETPLENRTWTASIDAPGVLPWLAYIGPEYNHPPGLNGANIHLLFHQSPFCTPFSGNKRFEEQIGVPENKWKTGRYFNRPEYEREIALFPEEYFVVVQGPGTVKSGGAGRKEERGGEGNLLWVVEQRVNSGRGAGERYKVKDHYIIVADMIFAGPSVWEILQSRWTASMLHLSTYYRTASTLPIYSIAKGYSYINPSLQPRSKPKSGISSARTSRAASPTGSVSSLSLQKDKDPEAKNDDFEIARSFQLTLTYADEYMDENPLIGEPGNFKLSSTSRNIKDKEAKERERERLAAAAAAADKDKDKKMSENGKEESQKPSTVPSPTSAPAPLKTSLERKGTLGKGKSPTSAGSEGVKKRRKSKAPVTPGVVGLGL